MKRTILYAVIALLLAGCASGPAVPDWQMNAKASLDHAVASYLSGNDRVATLEFTAAWRELSRTGKPALVARAELIRCASRVASLVQEPCDGFQAQREDAAAPEAAYADYLAGQVTLQEIALLPPPHRSVAGATDQGAAAAVAAIDDPLSRLVAAGVLFRTGRASPEVIAQAIDTASAQGWRRPLLAWLGVQAMRAEHAGDHAEAARLRRRMALVEQP